MTVKEIEALCIDCLSAIYEPSEAGNITRLLLEHSLSIPLHELNVNSTKEVSTAQVDRILQKLTLLQEQHPIQYVLEEAWFYKFPFYVNPSVLIPRPETEELVVVLLEQIKKNKNLQPKILEVGTGSGCIAIAVKKELHNAIITAIDISADALHVAKKNAEQLDAVIEFKQIDFLNEENWALLKDSYDYIISNPPYIPILQKSTMHANVLLHEPHLALFVENDNAFIFYQKIAKFAKSLQKSVVICCEINEFLSDETKAVFLQENFSDVYILKDMQQKDRIVMAK